MGSTVQLFDDLDETIHDDVQVVKFTYNEQSYEIDLGVENRVEFDQLMQKYIDVARAGTPIRRRPAAEETVPKPAAAAGKAPSAVTARNARIRAWARENGHEVLDGGRIKGDIIREYEAANPDDVIS